MTLSRTSRRTLAFAVVLAAVGALTVGWQATSRGQQNVDSTLRPPSRPNNETTGQHVDGTPTPPSKPKDVPSTTSANLLKAKGLLDDMISTIGTRLKQDPQAILRGLDSDGASGDVSVAVLRRSQALKRLLQHLK